METENNRPKIGVGVMVKNEQGKALLGLRLSKHGYGSWSFPGGHLEFGETMEQAAIREAHEETGMFVSDLELVSLADELGSISKDKHYVNVGFVAHTCNGKPFVTEPEKWDRWEWFSLDQLPSPLFEGTALMIERYKQGKIYK